MAGSSMLTLSPGSKSKVSNLILNMNVYLADVASQKMAFVHSVDIRGNTDESWMRSLTTCSVTICSRNPLPEDALGERSWS